jgi:hypothetical protein
LEMEFLGLVVEGELLASMSEELGK